MSDNQIKLTFKSESIMKYLHKYLHVYLEKGLHPQDGMPCHEATKYAHNDQVPLTMLPCPGKTPHSE